ncbi:MAG: VOC family protein [Pseudomonadota bacterium]
MSEPANQRLAHVALVVRDYDEAIAFYCGKLGFTLIEDTAQPEQDKRWVVVAPLARDGSATGSSILLAKASKPEQEPFIGNQAGGRVFLFLATDDFERDYEKYRAAGVTFVREPKDQPYGRVAVFEDLYGTLWDLVEFVSGHPAGI